MFILSSGCCCCCCCCCYCYLTHPLYSSLTTLTAGLGVPDPRTPESADPLHSGDDVVALLSLGAAVVAVTAVVTVPAAGLAGEELAAATAAAVASASSSEHTLAPAVAAGNWLPVAGRPATLGTELYFSSSVMSVSSIRRLCDPRSISSAVRAARRCLSRNSGVSVLSSFVVYCESVGSKSVVTLC